MTVPPAAGRYAQFMQYKYYSENNKSFYATPNTSNLLVLKDLFVRLGGFDESFKFPAAEDYDFCFRMRKLGYEAIMLKDVSVTHNHVFTLGSVLRRAFLYEREGVSLHTKYEYDFFRGVVTSFLAFLYPLKVIFFYPFAYKITGFLLYFAVLAGRITGWIKYAFKRIHGKIIR
jgi:GT2 family glycosyltransferase